MEGERGSEGVPGVEGQRESEGVNRSRGVYTKRRSLKGRLQGRHGSLPGKAPGSFQPQRRGSEEGAFA